MNITKMKCLDINDQPMDECYPEEGGPFHTIELESRYDLFKLPIEQVPDGGLYIVGKDGWFLTNKKELVLWRNFYFQPSGLKPPMDPRISIEEPPN